ncbi:helix-turn-helix domain-containing protein [Pelagibacterium limicola]|uniref:helix-turn-helix domain-containing protein n=1 Tax=Pelagibacterium limicola TaxID=2791022 RepID=UPI0018AFB09D|nr:helix-turn-helix domain-containing protein [Pelagibacterium limicola]
MFGPMLKHWRQVRGISQMDLALEASVSARHVSFLETGRARPSVEMTIRLAEALAMPLRERNALLVAAGFAPRYGAGDWSSPELADVRAAARLILDTHSPYPAMVFDGCFTMLDANDGAWGLLGEPGDVQPNLVDLVFTPGPVRSAIGNWPDIAAYFLHRLRHGARINGPHAPIAHKLRQALAMPGVRELEAGLSKTSSGILLPLIFLTPQGETRWFTTVTHFGGAQDALAEEITIEMFHPVQ